MFLRFHFLCVVSFDHSSAVTAEPQSCAANVANCDAGCSRARTKLWKKFEVGVECRTHRVCVLFLQEMIEQYVHWNEDIGEWQLKCVAYTGNNMRKQTPQLDKDKDKVNDGNSGRSPQAHWHHKTQCRLKALTENCGGSCFCQWNGCSW